MVRGTAGWVFLEGSGIFPVFRRTHGKSAMWVNLSFYPTPASAAELQPAAEEEQWAVVEVELAPALLTPPPLALEPVSPPPAVLEVEQGPTWAPAGVGAAELESPGPSFLVRSPSPPVALKEREKLNLTAFPPKLVVEQLTAMDAELFQKVVPSPCLGSTWGKRKKPGNEHQTPNVQATVDQVRRVASFVITPCLGDPSMTAQDRVRVVERWIQLAQECKILKNFSSPCTVISALQKTSTSHLKNTRGKFPGEWDQP
ncbi:ral guanine nucleotide dissociation stimulator-like isoform X1 [Diceros bicornis minor]|uniref:ral guanine nucleotide dissociation stimulator-like isoform X1 n=1 Tax=Diceros bicornis minor TaxID=77932 RepID=UPI0026ED7F11|nr:ral guanine nucleotide dissociation stimulator-like isoform X1 [Diceros bicornis minor]XP_058424891.1 ral guanine nucleotide dissociation stimulator-like isoform X1 [Diceros bicornis minor]XP_058424892.1 ral guanine nucleotide dissociation stimulator-like isoform X1 [Diceros bicornis minor]XP_058424893.1 ral guanine nucleotide dissociation stimulator-like isoform X1 [Diceros bicornis minor]XP_058424894.1 ral guanine nucleotide dissociation stimulator-like isoform X1 [Diceros bicornis minor]